MTDAIEGAKAGVRQRRTFSVPGKSREKARLRPVRRRTKDIATHGKDLALGVCRGRLEFRPWLDFVERLDLGPIRVSRDNSRWTAFDGFHDFCVPFESGAGGREMQRAQ